MTSLSKPNHEIILTDSPELLVESMKVRVAVFVEEQGFPLHTEIDEYDEPEASVSFLLRLIPSQEPIGTVRLVPEKLKIGRLCILKDYRKYGFGSDLMVKTHKYVAEYLQTTGRGEGSIIVHSQIPAIRFYSKLGYIPIGDEFDEEGAPHQKMKLSVSA